MALIRNAIAWLFTRFWSFVAMVSIITLGLLLWPLLSSDKFEEFKRHEMAIKELRSIIPRIDALAKTWSADAQASIKALDQASVAMMEDRIKTLKDTINGLKRQQPSAAAKAKA
jgi:hypothetical protein